MIVETISKKKKKKLATYFTQSNFLIKFIKNNNISQYFYNDNGCVNSL